MSQPEDQSASVPSPGHFLRHVNTGLYVHPEGGRATIGAKLVFSPGPHRNSRELKFEFRSDGSIIHVASGLAVHPIRDSSNAELVLLRDSPERRCQFIYDPAECCFYFRHGGGRFYIHPSVGKAAPGVHLMLHPGPPADAFKGELRYAFEPEYKVLIEGSILHCRSGLYLHPEGGVGKCNAKLVLHHDAPLPIDVEQRLIFTLRADGNLQHTESGLFVHPYKGSAYNGCTLVLHPDGPEQRLAFHTTQAHDLLTSGFFTHADTGLCLAPRGGKGVSGGAIAFTDDVESFDADFRFVTASETRAQSQFAADMSEACAESSAQAAAQALQALQRRGQQLAAASEKSQSVKDSAEVFAENATQLRKEQEKKSSFWPF